MISDSIREVAIDGNGRLLLYPTRLTYPFINREGREVHWDDAGKFLSSPTPREWSRLDWFKQMIRVAEDSTHETLELSENTLWTNIPEELKSEIKEWMNNRQEQYRTADSKR